MQNSNLGNIPVPRLRSDSETMGSVANFGAENACPGLRDRISAEYSARNYWHSTNVLLLPYIRSGPPDFHGNSRPLPLGTRRRLAGLAWKIPRFSLVFRP